MNDKQLVANYAVNYVQDGMVVGLGTGSTADCFIDALADRVQQGLQITTVASSVVSMLKAKELGLPLLAIEQLTRLDLYVDGADEVSPDNTLLKGQGADLVREKLLAKASDQFIVLIDQSKKVDYIGARFPIPIEVMPFGWQLVKQSLEKQGGRGELRVNKQGGFAVSAHGSLILDMNFDQQLNTVELNQILNATPGVVEHGIFQQLASLVLLAKDGEVEEITSV